MNVVISGLALDVRAYGLGLGGSPTAEHQPSAATSQLERHLAANPATRTCIQPTNQRRECIRARLLS